MLRDVKIGNCIFEVISLPARSAESLAALHFSQRILAFGADGDGNAELGICYFHLIEQGFT